MLLIKNGTFHVSQACTIECQLRWQHCSNGSGGIATKKALLTWNIQFHVQPINHPHQIGTST
jgi:hypothetical protein